MTQWVKMLAARHDNLSLSQRFTWWKERTDSSRDFHRQAAAHAVSVWAVRRCRVFLIPCRLCCMSEAHTDICLTRLPFQCLSDPMNKYLWVHAWECQEPDFHRSFQWPNRPCPPSPSSPAPSYRWGMGLEVFSAHISFRLINLESFLFLFCLWVSTSSLANRSPCYYTTQFWRMGHLSNMWLTVV